jgi:hypothetical protein
MGIPCNNRVVINFLGVVHEKAVDLNEKNYGLCPFIRKFTRLANSFCCKPTRSSKMLTTKSSRFSTVELLQTVKPIHEKSILKHWIFYEPHGSYRDESNIIKRVLTVNISYVDMVTL